MCVMEVRAGQRNSTIAQACAHNVNTVVGDLDMFVSLLRANGHAADAQAAANVQATLSRSYVDLREMFATFAVEEPHNHGESVGNERESALTLAQAMDRSIKASRRYETR